jgi:ABC-type uncharacterized transport system auxiliary subunit
MMKKSLILCVILSLLTACSFGPGKLPPVNSYLFAVKQPKQRAKPLTKSTLEILPMQANADYAGTEFIYRVKGSRYLSDYYHVFLVDPPSQLAEITESYLENSSIFTYVSSEAVLSKSFEFILKPSLQLLYADYRNPAKPKAVVAMRFILLDNDPYKKKIVLNKVYSQAIPLAAKTNVALVAAWNRGLKNIYRQLSVDIRSIVR